MPPAVGMWSLNHWTARDIPPTHFVFFFLILKNLFYYYFLFLAAWTLSLWHVGLVAVLHVGS